jgi:alpha-glucosidase (family GH31 glycosyl hydrolase)
MLGDYIFTKAITSASDTVNFSLPKEGKWMDFWTKTIINGGTNITKTYPLSQFPLFIKAGAIIPMNITNGYSGIGDSTLTGKQTIYLIPNQEKSVYQYFRPLGDGIEFDSIQITYDGQLNELYVTGKNKLSYVFLIQKVTKPIKVLNADQWKYNEAKQELLILKKGNKFSIKLKF